MPPASATTKRRVLRWGLEPLLLLSLLLAVGAWQTRDLHSGALPNFSVATLDGSTVTAATLRGRPTLLVFWAPWCGVCKLQARNISWLQGLLGERIRVYSVASSYRDLDEVRAYQAAHAVDHPILIGQRSLAQTFGVSAFPTAFFLRADGSIKRAAVGYTTTLGLLWRVLL